MMNLHFKKNYRHHRKNSVVNFAKSGNGEKEEEHSVRYFVDQEFNTNLLEKCLYFIR